jgi:leucyl aminopeptidase
MDIRIVVGKLEEQADDVLIRFSEGKASEVLIEPSPVGCSAKYLLTVGLGEEAEVDLEVIREATGVALSSARGLKISSLSLALPSLDEFAIDAITQAMHEAILLATYSYSEFKKPSEAKLKLSSINIIVERKQLALAQKGFNRAATLIGGVTLARDLVNQPPNNLHPQALVDAAQKIAKSSHGTITLKVLDEAACAKLGMGSYLAVGAGSEFPSKFIHLTYTPKTKSKKSFAIVGKGITFDSGGLSLKPADAMMTMKCDMGGAAAVLGLFSVIATLAPKATVHGIIAAAENMPSGKAMRPGDIVTAMNGKTIEILNTDAEGRLTLADALCYAVTLEPTAVVDLATLTGACVVALGEEIASLMTNDENLAVELLAAADRAGEKLWEMPLPPRYKPLIESEVADLRNIATSRYGGSLTAGLFLQEFVGTTPWAHLDIAGPAFAERPLASYLAKGGTGYAVRTLAEWLTKLR